MAQKNGGVRQAQEEIFGVETVTAVLQGEDGQEEALENVVRAVELVTEVGPRLLLPGAPQPVERRSCLRAVAGLAVAGLSVEGDVPSTAALSLTRLLCTKPELTKRAPRDTASRVSQSLSAALAAWLPSLRPFDLLRHLARVPASGPNPVITGVCDARSAGSVDAADCATAVAFIVATHGVVGKEGEVAASDLRCSVATVKEVIQRLAEEHRVTVAEAAALARGGADAGFVAPKGAAGRGLADLTSELAGHFGSTACTGGGNAETVSEDSDDVEELTGAELGFRAGSRVTLKLLLRSVMQASRNKGEAVPQFLNRLTHLKLSGKELTVVENLHLCKSLRCLYLDENKVEGFGEGLQFCAASLTHLYAQGNLLRTLDGCQSLRRITKLYLNRNCLTSLHGIESLTSLQELHASHQSHDADYFSLQNGEEEESVFQGLTELCVLKLSAVGMVSTDLQWLAGAKGLQELSLVKNRVESIDMLAKALSGLRRLRSIEVAENPFTKQAKWKDSLILSGPPGLRSIDGAEVTDKERQFLRDLSLRRKGGGARVTGGGAGGGEVSNPRSGGAASARRGSDGGLHVIAGPVTDPSGLPLKDGPALPALPTRPPAFRRGSSGGQYDSRSRGH